MIRLTSTAGAKPVNFEFVTSDQKAVPERNLFLQFFDGLVLKLDNGVATCTDQVIVVFTCQDMFVTGLTIVQQYFAGQSGFGKQLQSAVDRGMADAGMACLNLQVKLFNTDMLVGGQENIQDNIPLAGGTKSFVGSKFAESLFLFKDHHAPLIEHGFQYSKAR